MKKISIIILIFLINYIVGYSQKNSRLIGESKIYLSSDISRLINLKNKELLFRYLVTNPEWKVSIIDNLLVAEIRNPYDKYFSEEQLEIEYKNKELPINFQWIFEGHSDGYGRIQLILNGYNDLGSIENYKEQYGFYDEAKNCFNLKLYEETGVTGSIFSNLILELNDFRITISENTNDRNRNFSKKALNRVTNEIEKLLSSKEDSDLGFCPTILPKGSIIVSKDSKIYIFETVSITQPIIVCGFINPQQKGYIYLKAINSLTGKSLFLPQYQQQAVQYSGWSANPDQKFFFSIDPRLYERWYDMYVRFEVWFHPVEGDSTDKMLVKKNYRF